MTNRGTFSDADFSDIAVCNPTRPEYAAFLAMMHDPRLCDPIVTSGDLNAFLPQVQRMAA